MNPLDNQLFFFVNMELKSRKYESSISHKVTSILTSIVTSNNLRVSNQNTFVYVFILSNLFCFFNLQIFVFVSAKWSSNEDLHVKSLSTNFREGPPVWTPRSGTSPNPDNKDFRPVNFDSNSLKKKQQQQQGKKEDSKVRIIRINDYIIQHITNKKQIYRKLFWALQIVCPPLNHGLYYQPYFVFYKYSTVKLGYNSVKVNNFFIRKRSVYCINQTGYYGPRVMTNKFCRSRAVRYNRV